MTDFKLSRIAGTALIATLALTVPALAQDAAEAPVYADAASVAFTFNTFSFLVTGFLVMWMAAGFAMLEAGLVRRKNVAMQSMKNITLYSVAGLLFWLVGYNLMYMNVADNGGFFGVPIPVSLPDPAAELSGDYAAGSDWFFQMVFCATAASVVSGTVAERIKFWPFMFFTVVLTAIIYPITGSWQWGGGWLAQMGFSDFAGSTLVHSVGGWAALSGALILGARKGKYGPNGSVTPMPGSSIPLATLGTFILWLGWFGFNGGSQLALDGFENASAISRIFVNTNLAAAAGVVAVMILTQLLYKKVDVTMVLNGALAGLVSITAEPLAPTPLIAIFVGAIGGVIVVFAVPMLDKLKIDDVVGAIPVHLLSGIWGTLIVPLSNSGTSYGTQIVGIVAIGVFTFVVSSVVWFALKATTGLRVTEEEEALGLDKTEVGVEAYPEF